VGLLTVHKINFASTATFPGGDLNTLRAPRVGNLTSQKFKSPLFPTTYTGGGSGDNIDKCIRMSDHGAQQNTGKEMSRVLLANNKHPTALVLN